MQEKTLATASMPAIEHAFLEDSLLFNALPLAVCVYDVAGRIQKYNPKAVELWGEVPVLGQPHERFWTALQRSYPDAQQRGPSPALLAVWLTDMQNHQDLEVSLQRPDQSSITVGITLQPLTDQQGIIVGLICCFSDITQQKQVQQQQDWQREQLQDYVDNAVIGLHWVDQQGIIKWANAAEMAMLGYTKEEYIGRHIAEFHADPQTIEDILTRLGGQQTLQNYEAQLRCKDGSLRTVQISSSVFRREGQFIHTRCFTVDVTPQKRLMDALQESEHRYRRLLENLPVAVYTCDQHGFVTLYNQAAVELWGRSPQLGRDQWCGSWQIFYPDGSSMPLEECPMALTLKEGRPLAGREILVQRPDGTRRSVVPHPIPQFNAAGELVGAVNTLIDVTAQKQVQRILQESEERFKIIANTAPVLIWMAEPDGNRTFFNTGWLAFTGRSPEQEAGYGWTQNVYPQDLPRVLEQYQAQFDQQLGYTMEYRLRHHSGEYRWMLLRAIPRFTPEGSFAGFIGTCVDIQEKKAFTDALEREVEARTHELKEVNEQLLQHVEQLEHFNYAASHDLQEPLRKVLVYNTLVLEKAAPQLGQQEKDFLTRSVVAAQRMKNLIDNLLNYSRSSSTQLPFERVDLNEILSDLKLTYEETLESSAARLEIDRLPVVWGIAFQLRQLFDNLLGNALKYRSAHRPPQIGIRVTTVNGATLEVAKAHQTYYQITVMDNGIGFDPHQAEKVFALFQRLHTTGEYAGTGIGLAICKRVVENHQGFIKARGAIEQGAQFEVYLPVWDARESRPETGRAAEPH